MPQKSSSGRKDAAGPDSPIPPEWHWFLQALDQKLDSLRQQTTEMIERVHQDEMKQQQLEQGLQQQLHQHRLDLQELQQSLQYLSHKTQLQLKDTEKTSERFMHETERKVADFHFATREELSTISRRVEILEKLLL